MGQEADSAVVLGNSLIEKANDVSDSKPLKANEEIDTQDGKQNESKQPDVSLAGQPKVELSDDVKDNGDHDEPVDVLYCLRVHQHEKPKRTFYKDSPWKGVNNGLPGSGPDDDENATAKAVLVYYVTLDVLDKTGKESNTSDTWRENPVDFEIGRDATFKSRYWPYMKIYSKKLINLLNTVLDYWPYRGDSDCFDSELEDNFVHIMSCYAELKEYFVRYLHSLTEERRADPKLDIGNCGDEELADARRAFLDFGSLDMTDSSCDDQTASDLAVLLRLLAGMYRVKMVPALTSIYLESNPKIQYKNLWMLFRPGTMVYVKQSAFTHFRAESRRQILNRRGNEFGIQSGDSEDHFACIVSEWVYNESDRDSRDDNFETDHLKMELWNVHFDGNKFQRIQQMVTIESFKEWRALQDLPVKPALLYDKLCGTALRDRIRKKGQKYLSIIKEPAAIRTYNQPHKDYDGEIIIDPDAYRQYHNKVGEILLYDGKIPETISDGGAGKRLGGLLDFDPSDASSFPLLDEVIMLFPRDIAGFAIRMKGWMIFEIEYISEEAPRHTYHQIDSELILISDSDKDTLRTVRPRGERAIGSTPDFIEGKGEGKIFLLYGGPGTGKTLTVECVANDTCRPLLRLTAQDVGLQQSNESYLRIWFTLAAKWDAILLIDEADLFLEQRKEGDLKRNSLSTVFLRTMEYYKGVLFLTTNRPGHIDDSFISRITYPIHYPPLSKETKGALIQKFVDRFEDTSTIDFEANAVKYLKTHCDNLNGRQIRNMLQNAVASAEVHMRTQRQRASVQYRADESDQTVVKVNLRHIKAAVERQSEFQEYLQELRGRDEKSRARSKHDYLTIIPGIS